MKTTKLVAHSASACVSPCRRTECAVLHLSAPVAPAAASVGIIGLDRRGALESSSPHARSPAPAASPSPPIAVEAVLFIMNGPLAEQRARDWCAEAHARQGNARRNEMRWNGAPDPQQPAQRQRELRL